jgi:hypothetical protein
VRFGTAAFDGGDYRPAMPMRAAGRGRSMEKIILLGLIVSAIIALAEWRPAPQR